MMDDLGLMHIYADTCFTYDALGRMLRTNEPREDARCPAPRLYLGWTAAGHVVRLGAHVPPAQARTLTAIIERHPPSNDPQALATTLTAVRGALVLHAPIAKETGGPVYCFPTPIMPRGATILMTPANRDLARDTFPWLYNEVADWQPCFAVVRDGAAVSVCFSARLDAGAAAAGVETLADFRGRGYAAASTAAWGAAIRTSGRIPLYSTWWENLASQGVARRVGLILIGADATWS